MTKLSLSESLHGIKKRKSPNKRNTLQPMLSEKKSSPPTTSRKISVSCSQHKPKSDGLVKVIRQTPKKTRSRGSKKPSRVSPQKDIFQIQKQIQNTQNTQSKPKTSSVAKVSVPKTPLVAKVSIPKTPPVAKDPSVQDAVMKKSRKENRFRSRSRSKSRLRSRSRSRSRSKPQSQPKPQPQSKPQSKPRSSVSQKVDIKVDDSEDIETIKQKIQEIRNKKSKYIREHLKKQGVRVSGKSDRLLKDIYFYSTACNINIKHEQ